MRRVLQKIVKGTFATIAILAVVVVALTIFPAPSWAGSVITVTDARIGSHQSKTRIVLDLTGRVSYRTFTLSDPDRVVIDLPEVRWELAPSALPANDGLVRKLRYGTFRPGNSRLVIECNGPVFVNEIFMMKPDSGQGYRLVMDLTGHGNVDYITGHGNVDYIKSIRESLRSPSPKPTHEASFVPPSPQGITFAPARPAKRDFTPPIPAGLTFFPPPARPRPQKNRPIIVIDPGHGGMDPGAQGVSRIYEKDITLAVAREVRNSLQRTGDYKVVLTRDRDVYIRLRDRVAFAKKLGADLFISVHADSMRNESVRGASVYTLSERASDAEAAALAEQENKVDLISDMDLSEETPEVAHILLDLAQRESMNRSAEFAELLASELGRETRLLTNTHRFAGFAVLKAPDIPSVLVELGFLSNPRDARLLLGKAHQKKLAAGISRAVDMYFARVQLAQLQ